MTIDNSKFSRFILLMSMLCLIPASRAANNNNDSKTAIWIGQYVTTKTSPKMKEEHEINTVCQKIKVDNAPTFEEIVSGRVELKGHLMDDHFVIRYKVPAKELHLIKHNSRMFCAITVETEKRGTFLGRPVTFVSGTSKVGEDMKVEVLEQSESEADESKEPKVPVFQCKDKRGNPVFQDSPCEGE